MSAEDPVSRFITLSAAFFAPLILSAGGLYFFPRTLDFKWLPVAPLLGLLAVILWSRRPWTLFRACACAVFCGLVVGIGSGYLIHVMPFRNR